jgi:hypothetical protein
MASSQSCPTCFYVSSIPKSEVFNFFFFPLRNLLPSPHVLKSPFKAPQTDDYRRRVSEMAASYFCMILRSRVSEVPGFPILLTPGQDAAAAELEVEIERGHHLHNPIHRLGYSLVSTFRQETLADEWLCPLRRFLIVHFLKEDNTFPPVHLMSTDFSRMQLFFRYVGCCEAFRRRDESPEGIIG